MMAFVHGSKAHISLGTAATPNAPTDISQYITSVSFPSDVETAEVTTLGATAKSYLAGLENATISLEGRFHPTVDEHLSGIKGKDNIAFVYGPAGNAVGNPKYSGTCLLTSYSVDTGVDDVASFSAELQVTGPITRGTF